MNGWLDAPDACQALIRQHWIGLMSSCLNSHFGADWMLRVFYKPEISFSAVSILMKAWLEQASDLLQSR